MKDGTYKRKKINVGYVYIIVYIFMIFILKLINHASLTMGNQIRNISFKTRKTEIFCFKIKFLFQIKSPIS